MSDHAWSTYNIVCDIYMINITVDGTFVLQGCGQRARGIATMSDHAWSTYNIVCDIYMINITVDGTFVLQGYGQRARGIAAMSDHAWSTYNIVCDVYMINTTVDGIFVLQGCGRKVSSSDLVWLYREQCTCFTTSCLSHKHNKPQVVKVNWVCPSHVSE